MSVGMGGGLGWTCTVPLLCLFNLWSNAISSIHRGAAGHQIKKRPVFINQPLHKSRTEYLSAISSQLWMAISPALASLKMTKTRNPGFAVGRSVPYGCPYPLHLRKSFGQIEMFGTCFLGFEHPGQYRVEHTVVDVAKTRTKPNPAREMDRCRSRCKAPMESANCASSGVGCRRGEGNIPVPAPTHSSSFQNHNSEIAPMQREPTGNCTRVCNW